MRGHRVHLIALVAALALQSSIAQAQFSPREFLGSVMRPFRDMLGGFGHYPRSHRNAANTPASNEIGRQTSPSWAGSGQLPGRPPMPRRSATTFWPDDYAGQLRERGFDVIANTISGQFEAPREPNRTATTGAAVENDAGSATAASACNDTSAAQNDWPMARIEQTHELTDAQRANLDRLKTTLAQSVSALKAGCRDTSALAAPDRLNVLVQRLWAVRDAGIFIREPLEDVLRLGSTDAQKAAISAGKTPRIRRAPPLLLHPRQREMQRPPADWQSGLRRAWALALERLMRGDRVEGAAEQEQSAA